MVGLFFAARETCRRNPDVNRKVNRTVKSAKAWSTKSWKSTSKFFQDAFSKKSLNRKWNSVKDPF